jgi:hypothetical protein
MTCLRNAKTMLPVSSPSTFKSMVNRDWRSTKATKWVYFERVTRSPSQ